MEGRVTAAPEYHEPRCPPGGPETHGRLNHSKRAPKETIRGLARYYLLLFNHTRFQTFPILPPFIPTCPFVMLSFAVRPR